MFVSAPLELIKTKTGRAASNWTQQNQNLLASKDSYEMHELSDDDDDDDPSVYMTAEPKPRPGF